MPTVLVTGVAGGLATYLIPELLAHGYRIRGFDTKPTRRADVDSFVGDIRDFDQVRAAVEGTEAVCHLAAIPWDARPIEEMFPINVTGTLHVLEAARRCGVRRVLHTSSIRAYGLLCAKTSHSPFSPTRPQFLPITEDHPVLAAEGYALTKAVGDTLARCYTARGVSVIILRPGGVMDFAHDRGEAMTALDAAVHGPDVAQAFRLALETEREFGLYNVVSARRYNQQGQVQTAEERRTQLEEIALGPDICTPEYWAGEGNVYSTERIRRELGWEPTW